MIFLYTDFSYAGPYVGHMKAAVLQRAPGAECIDLMHDAPSFNPRASAYLLAALVGQLPPGSTILGVVDPGVGSSRTPMVLNADGHWFVGPGNGLFDRVAAEAGSAEAWAIDWRPEHLSRSFHGRDLFAPVAAALERGDHSLLGARLPSALFHPEWPESLDEVVYVDGYGNLITGRRADRIATTAVLRVGDRRVGWAETFSDVPAGSAFWYRNSMGLVEVAVNSARADRALNAGIGTTITPE